MTICEQCRRNQDNGACYYGTRGRCDQLATATAKLDRRAGITWVPWADGHRGDYCIRGEFTTTDYASAGASDNIRDLPAHLQAAIRADLAANAPAWKAAEKYARRIGGWTPEKIADYFRTKHQKRQLKRV